MNQRAIAWVVGIAALIALPFVYRDPYHLHILVLILIWSFAYTSWSIMGRFGLVSLGHGGFMGVGAYVTALLWNHLGVTPWIGIPLSMVAAGVLARGPLSRVPENRIKFTVGLLLTTFGCFWAAEGVGVEWPADELSLLGLLAFFGVVSFALVSALRHRRLGMPAVEADA